MKVALLLSGQVRNAKDIFPFFNEQLLSHYDIDVFVSSWKTSSKINPSNNFGSVPQDDNISDVLNLFKPKAFEFENYDYGYNDLWVNTVEPFQHKKETNTNLVSICSMFYKMMKVNQIKNNYCDLTGVKYDLVIWTRFDIKFEEKLNLDNIIPNTVYLPKGWDWSNGYNNLIAWGDDRTMNQYCNLFLQFESVLDSMEAINSEQITKQYIKTKTNIKVERPEFDLSLRDMNIKDTYWFKSSP